MVLAAAAVTGTAWLLVVGSCGPRTQGPVAAPHPLRRQHPLVAAVLRGRRLRRRGDHRGRDRRRTEPPRIATDGRLTGCSRRGENSRDPIRSRRLTWEKKGNDDPGMLAALQASSPELASKALEVYTKYQEARVAKINVDIAAGDPEPAQDYVHRAALQRPTDRTTGWDAGPDAGPNLELRSSPSSSEEMGILSRPCWGSSKSSRCSTRTVDRSTPDPCSWTSGSRAPS